jgi:LysM repeat protein
LLTKLKQSAWALVATVALSTAAFSALPNTAEAQDMSSVADAQGDNELLAPHSMVVAEEPAPEPATHATTAVIVNPGDSLWSIVQERLYPEAPPQQIALEVNRLYELNQDRIGGNPNLIFPGQEFLVPQAAPQAVPQAVPQAAPQAVPQAAPQAMPQAVMAEPAGPAAQPQTGWGSPASEEPATAAPAVSPALSAEEPVTAEPAAPEDLARSEGPATSEEPSTPQPLASEEPAAPEQVTEPVNEPVSEPAAPSNNAPTDEVTASPLAGIVDPLIDFYDNHKGGERQLLGVGILVLTALVAILMAWRLPIKRSADNPTAWGIPGGYYQERPPAADGGVEEDHKPAPASGAPEPTTRRGPSDPTATEESEPASVGGSESLLYPSLAARRRQERLRRIRQRTRLRPTRRAQDTREGW